MPDAHPSPWWYRQRALCITALYFIGIYGAHYFAQAVHRPQTSAFAFFGERFEQPILFAAVALAAIGWALRAWGTSYLRVDVVWNPDALADRLCIAGPFRFTRNPLYLGNLFQAVAFSLFAPPSGVWLVLLLQWLFITMLIGVEERGMRARYGAAFDAYCLAVPQLLPRIVPVAGEPAPHASFMRGLTWETLSFGFAAGMLVLAIFGRPGWEAAWAIAGAGVVLQYLVRWRQARPASR